MGTLEEFNKEVENIPDDELINKCRDWIHKLCETGGRVWLLKVPVDKYDPDILLSEIISRYEKLNKFNRT